MMTRPRDRVSAFARCFSAHLCPKSSSQALYKTQSSYGGMTVSSSLARRTRNVEGEHGAGCVEEAS